MQHHPVVQECFNAVLRLREAGDDPACADDVHALLTHALGRMLQHPQALRLPHGDAAHIGFALAALADEIAMRAPGDIGPRWQVRKLQTLHFAEHLAGEHFYDRLAQIQASGDGHEAALFANYTALALGFEGRHGGAAGLGARRALIVQLRQRLEGPSLGLGAPLSPYPLAQRAAGLPAAHAHAGRAANAALGLWAMTALLVGLSLLGAAQTRLRQVVEVAQMRCAQVAVDVDAAAGAPPAAAADGLARARL